MNARASLRALRRVPYDRHSAWINDDHGKGKGAETTLMGQSIQELITAAGERFAADTEVLEAGIFDVSNITVGCTSGLTTSMKASRVTPGAPATSDWGVFLGTLLHALGTVTEPAEPRSDHQSLAAPTAIVQLLVLMTAHELYVLKLRGAELDDEAATFSRADVEVLSTGSGANQTLTFSEPATDHGLLIRRVA